jgi:hypothetical protein
VASQLDIYNMALAFLDTSQTVQSLNDKSEAAGACNRFYDWARKKTLERAFWDFATKAPALSLVVDQATLAANAVIYPGWRFVYAKPVDCLRFLAITTQYGLRTNPYRTFWWASDRPFIGWGPYRPPFLEAIDQVNTAQPNQSVNLLTDQMNAYGVYVTDVTNVGLWSMSFQEAVAWQLAVPIAGPISANQVAKQNAIKMVEQSITTALQVQFGERQDDAYPDSPAITARQ